jgi:hypothetical protein
MLADDASTLLFHHTLCRAMMHACMQARKKVLYVVVAVVVMELRCCDNHLESLRSLRTKNENKAIAILYCNDTTFSVTENIAPLPDDRQDHTNTTTAKIHWPVVTMTNLLPVDTV